MENTLSPENVKVLSDIITTVNFAVNSDDRYLEGSNTYDYYEFSVEGKNYDYVDRHGKGRDFAINAIIAKVFEDHKK